MYAEVSSLRAGEVATGFAHAVLCYFCGVYDDTLLLAHIPLLVRTVIRWASRGRSLARLPRVTGRSQILRTPAVNVSLASRESESVISRLPPSEFRWRFGGESSSDVHGHFVHRPAVGVGGEASSKESTSWTWARDEGHLVISWCMTYNFQGKGK